MSRPHDHEKKAPDPLAIRTPDGWTLRGDRLAAAGTPVARAVLGHAMMVDRRTMDRPRGAGLASTLAARGIEVLNVDLRGHGQSRPSLLEGGRWSYDDFVRFDVPAIVDAARALEPSLPVVVVGHSLMGHAAILSAAVWPSRAPDAIVALAANLWTRRLEPSRARRWAKGVALGAWAGAMLGSLRWPSATRRLGSTSEPWPYVRQFLRMYFRNHLTSADGSIDYEAAMSKVEIPVLSISSEADRLLGSPAAVAAFMSMLPPGRVTSEQVAGLGHMGLVVDPQARPVWERVAAWIATFAASRLART